LPTRAHLTTRTGRALRIQRSNPCAAPRNTERRVVYESIFEMEVSGETTVYRPVWVVNSYCVHSLYQGTIQGSVVPNRASWIVWFVQHVLLASSAIMAGVGPAAVMPVIWGLGAGIMLILSVTKGTRGAFTGLEKACLVLSGLGLLLWATTGSPRLALVAGVSAALIGGLPTVVKAWVKSWTETMSGWLRLILGTGLQCSGNSGVEVRLRITSISNWTVPVVSIRTAGAVPSQRLC
jgi:hypothetical protein